MKKLFVVLATVFMSVNSYAFPVAAHVSVPHVSVAHVSTPHVSAPAAHPVSIAKPAAPVVHVEAAPAPKPVASTSRPIVRPTVIAPVIVPRATSTPACTPECKSAEGKKRKSLYCENRPYRSDC
jgi:hypothetical protein